MPAMLISCPCLSLSNHISVIGIYFPTSPKEPDSPLYSTMPPISIVFLDLPSIFKGSLFFDLRSLQECIYYIFDHLENAIKSLNYTYPFAASFPLSHSKMDLRYGPLIT